jgi:hypothetical protein
MARGGERAGAGRKPKPKLTLKANKDAATKVLASLEKTDKTEEKRWLELLNALDLRLRFDALKYLTDRRDGRPMQLVRAEGEIEHDHSGEVKVTVEFIGGAS